MEWQRREGSRIVLTIAGAPQRGYGGGANFGLHQHGSGEHSQGSIERGVMINDLLRRLSPSQIFLYICIITDACNDATYA
jgi:hypothetical protein